MDKTKDMIMTVTHRIEEKEETDNVSEETRWDNFQEMIDYWMSKNLPPIKDVDSLNDLLGINQSTINWPFLSANDGPDGDPNYDPYPQNKKDAFGTDQSTEQSTVDEPDDTFSGGDTSSGVDTSSDDDPPPPDWSASDQTFPFTSGGHRPGPQDFTPPESYSSAYQNATITLIGLLNESVDVPLGIG